ncbi:MAG: FAD binding domain-containing protein [Spirochaetaceae bacterium]|nr:FAD binding domain-containing protein [Spirochaetaceae bacterium]
MSTIFEPKTINSLLRILKKYPDALIYSSGLEKICQSREKTVSFNKDIIYIERIEELQRMNRSERYIEIGSATRINNIIEKGKNIIPGILLKAMKNISPPNFKNILTIGGMVCAKRERNTIFSVLSILDAKLEIRSSSSSKWISINHLFNYNVINLAPGEIVTKIRLYLGDYDISVYREINNGFALQLEDDSLPGPASQNEGPISFSAVVSLTKKNINSIQFIFSVSNTFVIRNKEVESNLEGQNIPIDEKLATTIISQFSEHLDKKYDTIKSHRKNIIINTLNWFIKELDYLI